ncbi:16S rRNA (guanine(1207)-N(2))-methyltransferase [Vibrio metoecus]|uniref:16S rRNA (guanine(1207)-N(2))-methyltransferase RsmC n=1 Tax=Vibrio metoecus TaxID=1481663 RepID=UPI000BA97672|nr:16S rRNA (guanine(1207)-N(2))-methyltransferase RsmC [Vibrio metoecus]PAR40526.1 16S rRNA (guanine(1207)-N(2))-methyltransferase [Vibrio metoecus]
MQHYTAPTEIALRQLDYFAGKHVLVAGEAEDRFPIELRQHCASVSVFTTHYGYYSQLKPFAEINCYFGEQLTDEINADLILLYWPKAKQEAEYLLAMLLSKFGTGTELVVVGENRSGVKSIEKMFTPYGSIYKYDSARRCSFYWGQCENKPDQFDISQWFKSYSVTYQGHELTIRSLPGVFSHGEFDLGSRLLLDTLPALSGKVIDIGCGAGVLGCVMAKLNPEIELEMTDISALAIRSSQETLIANQLSGRVYPSDMLSNVGSQYHYIVTNPPFHSGLDTRYSPTEQLLAESIHHLAATGSLWVVANSFLKYPPIIEQAFGHCDIAAKTTKFAIYHAKK